MWTEHNGFGFLVPDGFHASYADGKTMRMVTRHYCVSEQPPGPPPGPATCLQATIFSGVFSDTLHPRSPVELSQVRALLLVVAVAWWAHGRRACAGSILNVRGVGCRCQALVALHMRRHGPSGVPTEHTPAPNVIDTWGGKVDEDSQIYGIEYGDTGVVSVRCRVCSCMMFACAPQQVHLEPFRLRWFRARR